MIVSRAEVQQAGTPLFKAAGWIEPRPTAVLATALTDGVVDELLVVEGQSVEKGQAVAKLISADRRLALEQAKATLLVHDKEVASAESDLRSAKLRFDQPLHLEAALADAQSSLAETEAALAKLPFQIDAAQANSAFAEKRLGLRRKAADSIAESLIQESERNYAAAKSELQQLEDQQPRLKKQVDAIERKRETAAQQLKLRIEESAKVAESEARLKSSEARRNQATLAVEQAQLDLDRTVVRAPISGRVLQLVAPPGTHVASVGVSPQGSSTIVRLYDPRMLQVRADVRLEDVLFVQPGQEVQLETPSSKTPLRGTVLQATSTANIQKNTLEVKVAIIEPPPTVTPEMLVTATFIAPPQPEQPGSAQQDRLLVPRSLVEKAAETSTVWTVDATNAARRRSIRLGSAGTDALVEVVEGLSPTDKLIVSGRERLTEGERVVVTGDDPSLGIGKGT
ncbi:HlyD family efflux transporter periplasmic adaptor subunit [Caulifigura coniformis]|uniref:HlyD family efflux transporter periplasmic adaptor subunit n=1 Tax=Caulifigura coniformis TaxID=2527983 RepID=UPI001E2D833A|nr:HlyD family efflux transporter periplasmic adaptor subunit [Caulifigura coniformis]